MAPLLSGASHILLSFFMEDDDVAYEKFSNFGYCQIGADMCERDRTFIVG